MAPRHIGLHFCACGQPAYRRITGGEYICERCDRLEQEHKRRVYQFYDRGLALDDDSARNKHIAAEPDHRFRVRLPAFAARHLQFDLGQ
jgi:hypothetical protein